jgi:hypothetical protein
MPCWRPANLTEGWSEYEWRWKNPGFESKPSFAQPVWDGSNHAGTVLLTAEQGFGDTIQFIRYAPLVAARCRRVLLQCHRELVPLLDGAPGLAGVISRGQALPDFDVHCTLMTLPRLFATTLDTIPARVPYLNAEPARVAAWGAKLGETRRFKVGLAWAGSEAHKNDQHRSMLLSVFAPLSAIPGTLFVSLQKGPAALQIQSPPDGMELIDPTADLHDFADTAALIANLDLVISVDTAMVHLAGALAKPVWTLLPLVPDWRWLLNRSDSPWYPTMRLFRQPALGDWSAVMQRVAADLRRFMGEQGSRSPEPL